MIFRYWAIHDPINYATKRTKGRVYLMILLVWLASCIICLPPLIGWNDWPDHFTSSTPCMLTEEKGYIVYSSLGQSTLSDFNTFLLSSVLMRIALSAEADLSLERGSDQRELR